MDHTRTAPTTPSNTATDPPARPRPSSPYLWIGLATIGAAVGFGLSLSSTPLPGAEQLTVEDAVDLMALLAFGVLGAELLRRQVAVGLGQALMLLAGLETVNYLLGGVGDAIANGQTPPPDAARLCWMLSGTAFIAAFFLLVYAPLSLFPTGRLPSRRWRWLPWAAGSGIAAMAVSVLLAPGPVDDDNPATGANPLGVDALEGVTSALEVVAVVLFVVTLAGGLAAYVLRWFQYRGPRRRQLAWFTGGVVTMVVGLATDIGDSAVLNVVMALAIFGTLLAGMAWPLLGPLGAASESGPSGDAVPSGETVPSGEG